MAAGFVVLAAVVSGIAAAPAVAQLVKAALVQNVDEPGRNPFQVDLPIGSTAPGCGVSLCSIPIPGGFTVPSGKRLVITNITGQVFTTNGNVAGATLITVVPPSTGVTSVTLPISVAFLGGTDYTISFDMAMHSYFESGQTFQLILTTSGTFPVTNRAIRFSGYYVNL